MYTVVDLFVVPFYLVVFTFLNTHCPSHTATVGSTEIDSGSDAITTSDTDASWTATHNITGAFVQSGVNITVSVEAVVDDQLCDPAFASLLVPGGQYTVANEDSGGCHSRK